MAVLMSIFGLIWAILCTSILSSDVQKKVFLDQCLPTVTNGPIDINFPMTYSGNKYLTSFQPRVHYQGIL